MGRIPGIGACLYANVIGLLRHNKVTVLTGLMVTDGIWIDFIDEFCIQVL